MDEEPPGADASEPVAQGSGLRRKPEAGATGGSELWAYASLGGQLAVTVGLFVALGWWLDSKFGWTPLAMVVSGTLGVAVGIYQFVKTVLR